MTPPTLTSGLQAVLVKNARDEALQQMQAAGQCDYLYLAQGGLLGMNGNYGAGVLEGFTYFLPYTRNWLQSASIRKAS